MEAPAFTQTCTCEIVFTSTDGSSRERVRSVNCEAHGDAPRVHKRLTAEMKQGLVDHIRAELDSCESDEVATQMLGCWVISLVENAHLYPQWFKTEEPK